MATEQQVIDAAEAFLRAVENESQASAQKAIADALWGLDGLTVSVQLDVVNHAGCNLR